MKRRRGEVESKGKMIKRGGEETRKEEKKTRRRVDWKRWESKTWQKSRGEEEMRRRSEEGEKRQGKGEIEEEERRRCGYVDM